MTHPHRHLLLSAYACDPTNGSEPGVGWQILCASLDLAGHVTVLTRRNNAAEIERALPPDARATLLTHDIPGLTRLKKKVPFGLQMYYFLWQLSARRPVARLHRDDPVDVAHHVTIAADWMPTAISSLPDDVATVWGPVGGATRRPAGMRRYLGARGALTELVRNLTGELGRRVWGRATARRVRLTVAQNEDVARYFAPVARNLTVEPNAFIDPAALPRRDPGRVDRFRIVGVGRLVEWKGWALAVDALSALPDEYHLHIFGTGGDRDRLLRRARKLGVASRLTLRGWEPRTTVVGAVAEAGCLIHPSLHDSAPGAVAEALTIGTPVACLDVGGSAAISRASGSVPVPAKAESCVDDLAAAVVAARAPTDTARWSTDRLPTLISAWYAAAADATEQVHT